MSNAATTGLPFGSNRNVTCAIQAVAIEPPRLTASKRPDTASRAPASGSVALVFHRSRIIQAKRVIEPADADPRRESSAPVNCDHYVSRRNEPQARRFVEMVARDVKDSVTLRL